MNHGLICALLSFCILQGCATTSYVGPGQEVDLPEFHKTLVGCDVTITQSDGNTLSGEVISSTNDRIRIESKNQKLAVSHLSIASIEKAPKGIGGGLGSLIGAVGGGLTLASIAVANPSHTEWERVEVYGAAIGGALLGGLVGGVIGSVINHTIIYDYSRWEGTEIQRRQAYLQEPLLITIDSVRLDYPTYFVGSKAGREYRFNKAEATYSLERTATGVNITVRGTRGMFLRLGVISPQ